MDKERLVSDAACRGCVHYGKLYDGTRCCYYIYDTGRARPRGELPIACSVKMHGCRNAYIRKLEKEGKLLSD